MFEARDLPQGFEGVDTDAMVTAAQSKALKERFKEQGDKCLIVRGGLHDPEGEFAKDNPTADELRTLLGDGHAVTFYGTRFLLRDKNRDWSAETGAKDARDLAAFVDKLLAELDPTLDQGRIHLFVDLEGTNVPKDKALEYTKAAAAAQNEGTHPSAAYLDKSWPLTAAEVGACGFQIVWESGAKPGDILQGFAMVQSWPPVKVGGAQFDLDVVRADRNGRTPCFLVAKGWELPPVPKPAPAPPKADPSSDLAFRAVVMGESEEDRVVRILSHLADFPSRPLLEPGVQTVPWTCEVTARAGRWHASLEPEDGIKVVQINGGTFGADPHELTQKGFEAAEAPFLGGSDGWFASMTHTREVAGKPVELPWPIEKAVSHWTQVHTWTVCFAYEQTTDADRAKGEQVFLCLTVEGGQVAGKAPKGLKSWLLKLDGTPEQIVISDERHVDHCQRLVRILRRRKDGTIVGVVGGARWKHQILHEDMPKEIPPAVVHNVTNVTQAFREGDADLVARKVLEALTPSQRYEQATKALPPAQAPARVSVAATPYWKHLFALLTTGGAGAGFMTGEAGMIALGVLALLLVLTWLQVRHK